MFVLCVVSKDKKTKCRTIKKKKQVWMKCRVQENKKKSRRWHGCLSVVSVVCCQVDVSATGRSLVQRSPTDWGVLLCVV